MTTTGIINAGITAIASSRDGIERVDDPAAISVIPAMTGSVRRATSGRGAGCAREHRREPTNTATASPPRSGAELQMTTMAITAINTLAPTFPATHVSGGVGWTCGEKCHRTVIFA
ncbi:hypothetical protein GCM10009648_39080 [Tsukamurella spumae]